MSYDVIFFYRSHYKAEGAAILSRSDRRRSAGIKPSRRVFPRESTCPSDLFRHRLFLHWNIALFGKDRANFGV